MSLSPLVRDRRIAPHNPARFARARSMSRPIANLLLDREPGSNSGVFRSLAPESATKTCLLRDGPPEGGQSETIGIMPTDSDRATRLSRSQKVEPHAWTIQTPHNRRLGIIR